jgi:hypothetical protein
MKLFRLISIVCIVLVLTACAPVVNRVVQLPGALAQFIEALAVLIVGWVFSQIGVRLPWFVKLFGQYTDEIAFAISGAVIGAIQTWLNAIPWQWETVGNLALALVVAILTALQVFRLLGKAGIKSFRA